MSGPRPLALCGNDGPHRCALFARAPVSSPHGHQGWGPERDWTFRGCYRNGGDHGTSQRPRVPGSSRGRSRVSVPSPPLCGSWFFLPVSSRRSIHARGASSVSLLPTHSHSHPNGTRASSDVSKLREGHRHSPSCYSSKLGPYPWLLFAFFPIRN